MSSPQMTFGQGWEPFILNSIQKVIGTDNCPYMKIDNYGVLNMLQSQNKPRELTTLNRPNSPGQTNTVQVKYLRRMTEQEIQTTDNCTQTQTQLWNEASITTNMFSAAAIYLDDDLLRHYQKEAVEMLNFGTPATSITYEFIDQIAAACNAVYANMNRNLSAKLYANLGVNRNTGSNAAKGLNIPVNTTNLALNDGMTALLQDYTENLNYGKPQIVGSGLWHGYFRQQMAKGTAQNGLNTRIEAGESDFYYDAQAAALLGANQAVVIAPDAVQLVESFKFKGWRAGRLGTSWFFTITLPYMTTPNTVSMVEFDCQIREYDCPGNSFTDAYYGTPITVGRGRNMIISKSYDLFTVPADSYQAADPLFGNNGTLRYSLTNN